MKTLGDEMNAQIERVVALRERYAALQNTPGVNVVPVMLMIEASLAEARAARGSDDIARMIRAVEDLKGFHE